MTGNGTTNNWYFDTFTFFNPPHGANPTHFLLIEAEDYNYNGGQFQDNPPPSGLNSTGAQVNGNGGGYYDLVGRPGVDYFDRSTPPGSGVISALPVTQRGGGQDG